jgi:hypothetical protein
VDPNVNYISESAKTSSLNITSLLPGHTKGSTKFTLNETGFVVPVDITRRGGAFDFSFQAIINDYEHIHTADIKNVGRLQLEKGGSVPYQVHSKVDFRACIEIDNRVYRGHDNGKSCGTNHALEKVQGDLNDDVTFCFNVTNTGKCKLSHVVVKNIVLKFKDTTIGKLDIGQSVMIHVNRTMRLLY